MSSMNSLPTTVRHSNYRTGERSPLAEFLRPSLAVAVRYDRAVGYFRTSVLRLIDLELVKLALKDGLIRIVCSPDFDSTDLDVLQTGQGIAKEVILGRFKSTIEELMMERNETRTAVRILATLFSHNALELRIAFRPNDIGIYHEKLGLLADASGNTVSFIGSANETYSAWEDSANFEAIEVFRSWDNPFEANRVGRHEEYFEALWNSRVEGVDVIDLDESSARILQEAAYNSVSEALGVLGGAPIKVEESRQTTPRPHQAEAVRNWMRAGNRGIFEHATGSGKTISALLAAKQHVDEGKAVLVLVPSLLLVRQWISEIHMYFPDAIILNNSQDISPTERTRRLHAMSQNHDGRVRPRFIVSTLQTASKIWFRDALATSASLMIIADEVHRTGSEVYRSVFSIDAEKRLGLSATPHRFGDHEGTQAIFDYFGDVVEPKFTLQDAIASGALVPYKYHIKFADLSAEEAEDYQRLTNRISALAARERQADKLASKESSERLKMLLIQRSRIVKRAEAKTELAASIVTEHYRDGERWLIYCEDREQLADVAGALQAEGLPTHTYFHKSEAPEESLAAWTFGGGAMVAIRCLDEGINIPSISHAVILASSRNPREYIQRRGRVLRKAPGKQIAEIFDILVIPDFETDGNFDGLAAAEASRALAFAENAVNVDGRVYLRARLATHAPAVLEALRNEGSEPDE